MVHFTATSLTATSLYTAGLFATKYSYLLTSPGTIAADVAGIAMILILLTANGYVRRRNYEFFYIAHTILITVSLITGMSLATLPTNTYRAKTIS